MFLFIKPDFKVDYSSVIYPLDTALQSEPTVIHTEGVEELWRKNAESSPHYTSEQENERNKKQTVFSLEWECRHHAEQANLFSG